MPSFLRRCPVAVPKISPRHLSRRNFDRGHSLTSLYPPQAALRSLPAHRRCHCRGAEAHRRGDRGYHQGYVRFLKRGHRKMPSFLRRCPVAVPKISPRHLSRRNFDRGHSLTSLYPPQAALRSLPAHRRCHCRGAEAHRCGDRGYHQGHVGFCPERENLSLRASDRCHWRGNP